MDCDSCNAELKKYRENQNPLDTFLNERVIKKDGFKLDRRTIQNTFREYCEKECISTRGYDNSQIIWKHFETWYRKNFYEEPVQFKNSHSRGYRNIAFKNENKHHIRK